MTQISKVGNVCLTVLTTFHIFVAFGRNNRFKVDMTKMVLVEASESERCRNKMEFACWYRNLFVTNEHVLIVSFATNVNQQWNDAENAIKRNKRRVSLAVGRQVRRVP